MRGSDGFSLCWIKSIVELLWSMLPQGLGIVTPSYHARSSFCSLSVFYIHYLYFFIFMCLFFCFSFSVYFGLKGSYNNIIGINSIASWFIGSGRSPIREFRRMLVFCVSHEGHIARSIVRTIMKFILDEISFHHYSLRSGKYNNCDGY